MALPECDNCADTALPLKNCSRCKLVKYCGKPCQRQHWKVGHNKRCVAPEDRKPCAATESSDVPKCIICLDALHDSFVIVKEIAEYDLLANVKLKCGHKFHKSCALEAARESGRSAKCVICRALILAGESYERVHYKTNLFQVAMFNALKRPYPDGDAQLFAAKSRLGPQAAEVEQEVLEIENWNMLCEEWVNSQFLFDVFFLKA